ncbi:MAG: TonB-dependent receptor [Deltaproteobacteria bacterium]
MDVKFLRLTLCLCFTLTVSLSADTRAEDAPADSELSQQTPPSAELGEVLVIEKKPVTAASSREVRERDFELLPKNKPSDLLRVVPGLITLQHQGGGKADQFLLRGFNADHGTDVGLFIDQLPVNLRSHAHGQGYADLHFVIPETIETVEIYKGNYFTEFGDFSNAGAVRLITKDFVDENFVQAGSGFYAVDRFRPVARGLTLLSPIVSDDVKTLTAFEIIHDEGPFINENNFLRINGFGKLSWSLSDASELQFWISGYYGDWDASGQVPLRAVESGSIDIFGAIDPTEGGETQRYNAHLQYSLAPDDRSQLTSTVYFSRYKLDLFSNFTFFLADPVNGDGIVQRDNRYLYGTDTRYARLFALFGREHVITAGVQAQADHNDLVLGNQTRRDQTAAVNDADIFEASVSPFAQLELNPTGWARVVLGARGDFFRFDVDNDDSAAPLVPIEGEESDSIASFKANLILSPLENTDVFFNFGTGFHSNDARAVVSDPSATTLPRSVGFEIGSRTRLLDNRLDLAAAFWYLRLEDELVFIGDGGTFEFIGSPTRRLGGEFEARFSVTDWLFLHADLNITDAKFTDLEDDQIPLAPKVVSRSGVAVRTPFGLQGALEVLYIADRPAEETGEVDADGFTRVDLTLKYRYKNIEAFGVIENLLDTDYRDAQNFFESQLQGEAASAEDIHFTPGNPFSLRVGITYYFSKRL